MLLPRLASNLGELMLACVEGNLAPYRAAWRPQACVGVVLASGGYPGSYETGTPIAGLGAAGSIEGVEVFHAGTVLRDGRVVTAGGRVLTVSALGGTPEDARGPCLRGGLADRIRGQDVPARHRRGDPQGSGS